MRRGYFRVSSRNGTLLLIDMKIPMAVKSVLDFKVNVQIKLNGAGVDTESIKMSMKPFGTATI